MTSDIKHGKEVEKAESPPPYGHTQPVASSSTSSRWMKRASSCPLPDTKDTPPTAETITYPFPSSSSRLRRPISLSKSQPSSPKPKKSLPWRRSSHAANKVHAEVTATLNGLIRDLVRPGHSDIVNPQNVLQSCAGACDCYSLSFSDILQNKFIESHSALYWCIINCPQNSDTFDLITDMMCFAAPLTPSTISEIRLACLQRDDQPLFQSLRLSPQFAPLSGTDEMLLGPSMAPDIITVETLSSDDLSFVANFEIARFQKRMNVSKEVVLEFIARNRCWKLVFSVGDGKTGRSSGWFLTLSLLEESPATFLNAKLIIIDSAIQAPMTPSRGTFTIDPERLPAYSRDNTVKLRQSKPRPPIPVELKMNNAQLIPVEAKAQGNQKKEIKVPLDHKLVTSSLQNSQSSYISSDDTLRTRLEARLAKPESSCIIC